MEFSRSKAKMAQNREIHTTQPKEFIGIGKKTKIMIQNYLGGQYFLPLMMYYLRTNIYIFVKANIVKIQFYQVKMISKMTYLSLCFITI